MSGSRKKAPGSRRPHLHPQDGPLAAAVALALLLPACAAAPAQPGPPVASGPPGPYVLVLGTAQDGGLPQIGCEEACCRAAVRDPARRRLVTSLLLADPRSGRRWLLDATPDLPRQVELARGEPATRPPRGPDAAEDAGDARAGRRPPLFEGVFLTHAHTGHYAGLVHLGREAYGARGLPLYGSERMLAFLAGNAPWSGMVERGEVELRAVEPGRAVELAPDLRVHALRVPHRDEHSDTLAFVVEGPRRSLLYLPDIDKWERWERSIEDVLAGVDVALLDGTFFAEGEIPGRSMADIPHPFVAESLARFAALPPAERAKVRFTHLNHTNPAAVEGGEAARAVSAAGLAVAREGERHEL